MYVVYIDCTQTKCALDCVSGFIFIDEDPETKCPICECADLCTVSKQPYDTELYDTIGYIILTCAQRLTKGMKVCRKL